MTEGKWPGPRGRERSMSLAQFEIFQQTQAKLKADREAKEAEIAAKIASAEARATAAEAERDRLREALRYLIDTADAAAWNLNTAEMDEGIKKAREALEGRTDG